MAPYAEAQVGTSKPIPGVSLESFAQGGDHPKWVGLSLARFQLIGGKRLDWLLEGLGGWEVWEVWKCFWGLWLF